MNLYQILLPIVYIFLTISFAFLIERWWVYFLVIVASSYFFIKLFFGSSQYSGVGFVFSLPAGVALCSIFFSIIIKVIESLGKKRR